MVKTIFLSLLLATTLIADLYEQNCVKCHAKLPVSIDKYFYRYLLKYSSEKDTKEAMINYLTNPTKQSTVMPDSFIERFGVKQKTTLTPNELKEVIDIYWDRYDVSKRLR
ncbi:MAG: hypothetical protein JXQ66_07620 [Campylobacterales bacterium]|nr:hypothetical protein [Campylobacterales bacterium]